MPSSTREARSTSSFLVPSRFEASYRIAIGELIQSQVPLTIDDSGIDGWINRLAALSEDPTFKAEAYRVASRLVRDINIHNVFGWRETARKVTGGSRVYPYLHETRKGAIGKAILVQVTESAKYIYSIPLKVSQKLRNQVDYARSEGATEKGVLNILRRSFVPIIVKRINLVAQTDPHRVNSALTEARSEDLAVHCFRWNTLKDSSVRLTHRRMEGVVVFWRDLPSPESLIGQPATLGYYAPGNCPNCRCNAVPVLSIDELFPDFRVRVRVYLSGRIRFMTRAQFAQIMS